MNRRQFIAGLAASTAPMIGVGGTTLLSDAAMWQMAQANLPCDLIQFHENLNASFILMKEQFAANILNSGHTEDRKTLHGIS